MKIKALRYIQRLNKDVNKGLEIYTNKQRLNKDVNKGLEIYTKAKQRCKQRP